jgi:hypothetical protein
MNQDLEHLRLLSVFHYVVGGLAAFFACIPLIHLTIGLVMIFAPPSSHPGRQGDEAMLRVVGFLFAVFAAVIILAGWTFAVCVVVAGRNLARRRRYTFCLVMAALLCAFTPFGTVLGVFTILVLLRPSVKELFTQSNDKLADGAAQSPIH